MLRKGKLKSKLAFNLGVQAVYTIIKELDHDMKVGDITKQDIENVLKKYMK